MIHARSDRPSLASITIGTRRTRVRADMFRSRPAIAIAPEAVPERPRLAIGLTAADLRFLLSCYLGGLVFFATLLS